MMNIIQNVGEGFSHEIADDALALKRILAFSQK